MHDNRNVVKVQGQEVKGQGHSVTQRITIKKRYNSGTDKLSKVNLERPQVATHSQLPRFLVNCN